MPGPTDPNGLLALDAAVRGAVAVRLTGVGRAEASAAVTVDLRAEDELHSLRAALALSELSGSVCMCLGDVRLEFLGAAGDRLAQVALHHGRTLARSGWDGQAVLADGNALLRWLAGHGCSEPLRLAEQDAERRAVENAEEASWLAAVPAALTDLTGPLLEPSVTGGVPSDAFLAELRERLRAATPDPVARVLEVLAWYGAGSGRYSGFAAHEATPGRLLGEVPIAGIVAALLSPDAGRRHELGAVRHLISWRSRPRQQQDVDSLPRELRARLLRAAREDYDPESLAVAERWLAPNR
ncbi:hypothetical protein ACIQBJ_05050 [Kitasatospora sp. NPDC088391]|uniref:hypothetical protein n=1 Tax=Kitasatospora sp. NPDC088391 TaxID=3364074 RepID=UPI00381DBCD7